MTARRPQQRGEQATRPRGLRARWGALGVAVGLLAACDSQAGSPGGTEEGRGGADACGPGLVDTAQEASSSPGAPDAEAGLDALDAGRPPAGLGPTLCKDLVSPTDDPTDALFRIDCVLDVALTMAPAHWQTLRSETRPLTSVLAGDDCLDGPLGGGSPFTWLSGSATLAGQTRHQVGIRKKGFIGSLSDTKPSLKLRFDKHVDGQTLAGAQRLTLNNGVQDPGLVHQCLAYRWLASVGVPAPRCGLARVSVNGWPYGAYIAVEAIDSSMLTRLFGASAGQLYEATLSDFVAPFDKTWRKQSHEGFDDWSDLQAAGQALAAEDDGLLEALDPVFDLPSFARFWAAEVVTGHWDGFAGNQNNTYVYADPTDGGRFRFIAWGMDHTLVDAEDFVGEGTPTDVLAHAELPRRLYALPDGRALYRQALAELVAAWDAEALTAELQAMAALVRPHVLATELEDFDLGVALKAQWIPLRRAVLEAALAAELSDWPFGARASVCWPAIADVEASFQTVWGSAGSDPLMHPGTLSLDYFDPADSVGVVGNVGTNARLGTADWAQGEAVVEVVGRVPDGRYAVLGLYGPLEQVAPNTSWPVDWVGWRGVVFAFDVWADQKVEPPRLGLLVDGVLRFEEASTGDGELVIGSATGTMVLQPEGASPAE